MRRGDKSVFKGGCFGLLIKMIRENYLSCYLCGVRFFFLHLKNNLLLIRGIGSENRNENTAPTPRAIF